MENKKTILAVDDLPANLQAIKELIAGRYTLLMASSGGEALQIAARRRPDLVLLDVRMPGISGYDVCRQLKQMEELQHTKVLLVSALVNREERLAGYAAGADDYIVKPFDEEELLAKINVYLRLKSVEEVDHMKARVIEVLQHGARTPLTAIIGFGEILREGLAATPDEEKQAIDSILTGAHRLLRLLEKSEKLAAMKSQQFAFNFKSVSIDQLSRLTLDNARNLAANANVAMVPAIESNLTANCDPQQIGYVISQILKNAIQHSPPGSLVTLKAQQRNDHLHIAVSDEGPGVAPAVLPRLFHEFSNPEAIVHNCGDGLSLALAHQVMLAHRGAISAQSQPGSGATFTLSLPAISP